MFRRATRFFVITEVLFLIVVIIGVTRNIPTRPRLLQVQTNDVGGYDPNITHPPLTSRQIRDAIENYEFNTVADIRQFQEMQRDPKTRVSILELARQKYLINCSNVEEIKIGKLVGHGKYKSTYTGTFRGLQVAVKVVTRRMRNSSICTDKIIKSLHTGTLVDLKNAMLFTHCKNSPVDSVVYEIINHAILSYPNIVRNLGYCIRDYDVNTKENGILTQPLISVFEYGEPFCINSLSNLPLIERLQHCRDIANLLELAEHSVLGSISFSDMHTRHFVMADNQVKVIDLDSYVTPVETKCGPIDAIPIREKRKKRKKFRYRANCTHTSPVACVNGICEGLNAKSNVHYFTKIFFSKMVDKHKMHAYEYERIKEFAEGLLQDKYDAAQIKQAFDRMILKFQTGVTNYTAVTAPSHNQSWTNETLT